MQYELLSWKYILYPALSCGELTQAGFAYEMAQAENQRRSIRRLDPGTNGQGLRQCPTSALRNFALSRFLQWT